MLPLVPGITKIEKSNMFPMFTPFGSSNLIFNHGSRYLWYQMLRNMSMGSPGQSQGKRVAGRDFRLKVVPGTTVRERQIVATQLQLNYHPGFNVSYG